MNTVEKLRNEFPTFSFDSFSWKHTDSKLDIKFHYSFSEGYSFVSQLSVQAVSDTSLNTLSPQEIDAYVANIGMSELLSYWKLTASPNISISAYYFSSDQLAFWKQLLIEGMGEYFYQNKINFSDTHFVTFSSKKNGEQPEVKANSSQDNKKESTISKVLIPVGGGKDSALTLELLSDHFEIGSLTISAPDSADALISTAGVPHTNQLKVTRTLDPKMIALNSQGFLNGHVPISASIAFVSLLVGRLNSYSHIAISNERSSNEGNVWFCDKEINHQYSKTYAFETAFQEYVNSYLPDKTPYYFSFLRPLYELQIGMLFSQHEKYHSIFRSCNKGQKANTWCCNCSKCLFAWTILYPFIPESNLTSYFSANLFKNENLWPIAQELLGLTETKPFECVGTHEESIAAFWLCLQKYKSEMPDTEVPVVLRKVQEELQRNKKLQNGPTGTSNYQERAQNILSAWNEQHTLPSEFLKLLSDTIKKLT